MSSTSPRDSLFELLADSLQPPLSVLKPFHIRTTSRDKNDGYRTSRLRLFCDLSTAPTGPLCAILKRPDNQNRMQNSSFAKAALAYGLVGIFALPFCGFGLFAGVTALKEAASPNPDWGHVAYGMMFGLIFGAVGSGFLIAVAFGRRKMKAIEAAKASYPDSPWMWREDWAKGRVLSKTHSSMVGAWILAVFWNSISWFVVSFGWREIALKVEKKPAVAFVFLFPLVGIGIFTYA